MNTKLVLAGLLLAGGTVVALAGAAPQAALSPTQALEKGQAQDVVVKGMVDQVSRDEDTFLLTDGDQRLRVVLDRDLPAQIQPGTTLVAKGDVVTDGQGTYLQAAEIVIGCPSKYQA